MHDQRRSASSRASGHPACAAPAEGRASGGETVVGIGIDTADVAEVRAVLAARGDRYLRFALSPAEREELAAAGGTEEERALAVAGRWAAKEAVTKVLAPGPDEPWPWRQVEVLGLGATPCPPGGPASPAQVHLHGHPGDLARRRGVTRVDVHLLPAGPRARAVTATAVGHTAPSAPATAPTSHHHEER